MELGSGLYSVVEEDGPSSKLNDDFLMNKSGLNEQQIKTIINHPGRGKKVCLCFGSPQTKRT